jgi:hypothetical protein
MFQKPQKINNFHEKVDDSLVGYWIWLFSKPQLNIYLKDETMLIGATFYAINDFFTF